MQKQVICATGNQVKFDVISAALAPLGVILLQKKLELTEIQATSVGDVARFTAQRAFELLRTDVITTDAGCSIEALRGFPGPYIKYVNEWFTADDYLRLMQGQQNRNASFQEALGCCKAGKESVVFVRDLPGTLAQKAGAKSTYTSFNEIFIPEGFDKVSSEIAPDKIVLWAQKTEDPNFWQHVADYFLK